MKIKLLAALFASALLMSGCNNKVEEKPLIEVKEGRVAPAIEVGKPFESGTLKDQFGKEGSVTPDTEKVIIVFGKATGHLVKEYLNTKPNDFLAKEHVVFIADVSGMPSMILKYVALPDLQKHKYPIYLILDEKISEKFRNEKYKDYIMVVDLDHAIVEKVDFVTSDKDLENAID
ncbi:hypothetical protein [Hydrogenimonas cancrithermarum]|uniref:Periplasmic protein n=1 Tax=Hydrogenimonas cancrithermarum TaxID=2993563 RepID=A0ABN6WV46_9BACT|nr:hypothetical protein [Hydrogenimonas cancrithermarum]BDY12037.1 periplasmic protein [Hydrogenimonas cancrithermarum]